MIASDDPTDTATVVLAPDGGGELTLEDFKFSDQRLFGDLYLTINVVEFTVEAADVQDGYIFAVDIDGTTVSTDTLTAGASDEDLRDAFLTAINASGLDLVASAGATTNSVVLTADPSTPGSSPINPDAIRITNASAGNIQNVVPNTIGVAQIDTVSVGSGNVLSTQQDTVTVVAGNLDPGSEYSVQIGADTFSVAESVDFFAATATAEDIAAALATRITGVDVTATGNVLTITSQTAGTGGAFTLLTSSSDTGASLAVANVTPALDTDTVTANLEGTIVTADAASTAADTAEALQVAFEASPALVNDFTFANAGGDTISITAKTTGTPFTLSASGTGATNPSVTTSTAAVAAVSQEDTITLLERRISAGDTASIILDGSTYNTSAFSGGESLSDVKGCLTDRNPIRCRPCFGSNRFWD